MRPLRFTIGILGLLLLPHGNVAAAEFGQISTPSSDGIDFFERRIRPLLVERCYECHGPQSTVPAGGLRLDSREGLIRGGVSGPGVNAGDAVQTVLIRTIRNAAQSPLLMSKHRLSPERIEDLSAWIKLGVPYPAPADFATKAGTNGTAPHWSFQPLKAPTPPAVNNRRWVRNPVDQFILARIEAAGLAPGFAADKRILIRRATFDLIGLPPTPEQVDAFLKDRSPRAFERLIERLLASPQYGERWGRHWLDVARYADTSGDSADYPIPQAHKYRDYVIDSFNCDKPYDQFIHEQIAGDLMASETEEQWKERTIATGFVALSRRFGVDTPGTEHLILEDTLDTMGRAVLGLSMSCARCHDHKYDPISMEDYYGLYGIFASTRYPHPGSEVRRYQTNFVPLITYAELEALGRPYLAKLAVFDTEIVRLEKEMDLRLKEGQDTDDLKSAHIKVYKQRDELVANAPYVDAAYAVADDNPVNARIQKRGEPHNLGDEVPRRFLKIFGGEALPPECTGSGRLELAQWLTGAARPLAARVMVNRIWQHHFGRGLVATPSDFGTRGRTPTHPGLIEWLAERFIESGWSIKAMHRLILFSATYQQAGEYSVGEAPGAVGFPTGDPENQLLSRFPRQRLDAEQIRDAMLAVSGALDPAPAGPHPFPPPHLWDYTQHKQFTAVYPSRQRSVYLMQQRIKKHPFFALFDGTDVNASTAGRVVSTTPLQALFAMNDPFAHAQATAFATRLLRERTEDRDRIDRAHQLAFGRSASPEEVRQALDYLKRAEAPARAVEDWQDEWQVQVWASYARVLLGSNEFLFVD
jgi:hypothetical protein